MCFSHCITPTIHTNYINVLREINYNLCRIIPFKFSLTPRNILMVIGADYFVQSKLEKKNQMLPFFTPLSLFLVLFLWYLECARYKIAVYW